MVKTPSKPAEYLASQDFVQVRSVKNGVLVLKDGSIRKIIAVSGVNFELKSKDEQELITSEYQQLLHSIDFSLQIITHSRRLNIAPYLTSFTQYELQEQNEKVKSLIHEYKLFLDSIVKENAIVTKRFYAVVPYESINIKDIKGAAEGFLKKLLSRKKEAPTQPIPVEVSAQDLEALDDRVQKVISGLSLIGLQTKVLDEMEATELLRSLYNPEFVAPHEERPQGAAEETTLTL